MNSLSSATERNPFLKSSIIFLFNPHIKLFLVVGHGFVGDEGGQVGHADLPFLDLRETDVVDVLFQGRCNPLLLAPPSLVIV